jgi:gamma-glutamylcyclotransferase (GGCT)/AIG2-like uncharacterized protein YtfP
MELSLFVYGSLRPGRCNYDQLSTSVIDSQSVLWPGHLRLRPEGYPALILPGNWPTRSALPEDWTEPSGPPPEGSGLLSIEGEILRLRDSPELRHHLDDFEGFTPRLRDYLRVACAWQGTWVWTYVAPEDFHDWPRIERWPGHDQAIAPWR